MKKMNLELRLNKKHLISAVGISLIAGVFFLVVQVLVYFNLQYEISLMQRREISEISMLRKKDPFENLSLSSKAYLIWDVRDQKVIKSLNEEQQLPLASLSKLMTVYVVSNRLEKDLVLTIKDKNLEKEGDNGLISGEKWRVVDLIDFVLISSSNDGANALASINSSFEQTLPKNYFVEEMNNTAKKLGMTQSYFLNESGLDINKNISGSYGSAKDVTILLENILEKNPDLLKATVLKEERINSNLLSHEVKNTNIIVDKLPGVIASKTGFTDLAEGNLIMAFDIGIGHTIIISVLGSTKEERFTDLEKLFWASIESQFNDKSVVINSNVIN